MLTDSELLRYTDEDDLIEHYIRDRDLMPDDCRFTNLQELIRAVNRYREMRYGDSIATATMDYQPGEREDCKLCGEEILWNGTKWVHVTYYDTHKAVPIERPKTVEVRIAVAVDSKGNWIAAGWNNKEDEDQMRAATYDGLDGNEIQYWLTAELEVPEAKKIEASEIEKVIE